MGKRWTDKEDTILLFILRSRPDATYAEIAEVLHRTELSVRARCIRIRNQGVYIPQNNSNWTATDHRRVKELAEKHTIEQIAEMMGRSVSAVRCYCHRKGIITNKQERLAIYNRVLVLRNTLPWCRTTEVINKEFKTNYTAAGLSSMVKHYSSWFHAS